MGLNKDGSGRTWIEVEAAIPAAPAEVWKAVATGPGISAWFVPTELEGRVGGELVSHFGPGVDGRARVTEWDPPRLFVTESGDLGGKAPPLVTAWSVEPGKGGNCVVRVVHSVVTESDDWDRHLESWDSGWPAQFHILRVYLTRFRGMSSQSFRVGGITPGSGEEAWGKLAGALGLEGAVAGQAWTATGGVPPVTGAVERTSEGPDHFFVIIRIEQPWRGIALVNSCGLGERISVGVSCYIFGADAETVDMDKSLWEKWFGQHFPPPSKSGAEDRAGGVT